ncbi:MAG: hypothetical protein RRC34_13635 [Lentisphaeria bacterium]|nr:hypothetical protein [Lentisphaeria bacterium]
MRYRVGFKLLFWLLAAWSILNLQGQDTRLDGGPGTAVPEALPPVSPAGLRDQLLDRRERLARSAEKVFEPVTPGALPEASPTPEETSLALAALQVEKALDYLTATPPAISQADLHLRVSDLIVERNMTALPIGGRLTERAYFARNDRSPQPWFFFKPGKHDGKTPLPLVVFLHGYVPSTSRVAPFLVSDFVLDLAEEYGCYFAIPHGRTNTDFQYAGEVDVLRVIEEAKAFFPVDENRIYLLGISMGGAGVWHVSTHYPTPFAGVAPINGQGDWFRFWNDMFHYPARKQLPGHIQYVFGMNNPLDLAGNLSNLYSYSQHATRCFVGVGHTKSMVEALGKAGAPHDFFEDPDELGHYIYWRPDCWRRAFAKLLGDPAKTRRAAPRSLQYTTYNLRFPGAYWAEITRIQRWGKPASVAAEWPENGPLTLTTENVAKVIITVPEGFADPAGNVTVMLNGKTAAVDVETVNGQRKLSLTVAESAEKAPIAPKSSRVCGPVADVFNFPFIIVCGTGGPPETQEKNADLARRLAADWQAYAEGRARMVRDVDVTPDMMKHNGLVLIGFPDENSVYAEVAEKFPIAVTDNDIVLPDGASFSKQDHGLIMTQPNPLFPDRYVLVYAGKHWGAGRSPNHTFDCLPDFAVFTEAIVEPVGYNAFKAAGLFDSNWTYSRELTDFPAPPPPPEK